MFEIQRHDHNQPQFSRESLHLEGKRRPYKFLEFINAVVYSLVVQNLFLHVHGRFCLCAAPRRINFGIKIISLKKNRQKRVLYYYLLGFDKSFFVNRVVFVPEEKLVPSEETTEEDSSAEEFSESLKLSEIQEESTLNHS